MHLQAGVSWYEEQQYSAGIRAVHNSESKRDLRTSVIFAFQAIDIVGTAQAKPGSDPALCFELEFDLAECAVVSRKNPWDKRALVVPWLLLQILSHQFGRQRGPPGSRLHLVPALVHPCYQGTTVPAFTAA